MSPEPPTTHTLSGSRRGLPVLKMISSTGLPSSRAAGLRALGKLAAHSALDLFHESLESSDREIRMAAVEGLSLLGAKDSVTHLVKVLERSRDRDEQHMIGEALSRSEDEQAVDALLNLLKSRKISEQHIACNVLGEIGHRKSFGPLVERFLATKNRIVRKAAGEALVKLGDMAAIQPLVSALTECDSQLRESAAVMLGKFGDRNAIEVLAECMDSDIDPGVRARAGDALNWISQKLAKEGTLADYYFLEVLLPKLRPGIRENFTRIARILKERTRDPILLDPDTDLRRDSA